MKVEERKPHWTEKLPNGELAFCIKERRHGKKTIYRYTLRELAEILRQAVAEKEEEACSQASSSK